MVYIRANGIVLNIEVRGRGEPLVLISDLAEDLTSWCFQTSAFGSLHFLVRIDNRGSGWSDCPEGCSIDEMAKDIISIMDQVGVEKTHIVGLGLGGMVAQKLALDRPGRVNGLVLVSTSPQATEEQRLVLRSVIESAKNNSDLRSLSAAMLPWLYSPWFLENDRWREYVTRAKAAGLRLTSWEGAERQLEGMLRFNSASRLESIKAPTLVISGSEDLLVPPACSDELVFGISGAKRTVLNTGHQPHIELPRTFNQTVLGFLAEVEGSPIPDLGPGMPLPCGFGI
jgi:pimeloyl-ACP methyl ester carboxylesterase